MKLDDIKLVFGIIVFIGLVIFWSGNNDKKVMDIQDKYNQCVEKEYGVSVASWYEENGSLPECN